MPKNHPPGEPHRWVRVGGNRLPDGSLTPISWECHCGAKQKKRPEPWGTFDIKTGKYVRKIREIHLIEAKEYVMWAVKKGDPDWMEHIITTNPAKAKEARKWAEENGFDRFREANVDLSQPPDFTKTLSGKKKTTKEAYGIGPTKWNTYIRGSLKEGKWAAYQKSAPVFAKEMAKPFRVTTKEGPVSGKAGDYLCLGVENEMWPVDKEIFEKTMKKIASGAKLREIIHKTASGYRLVSHKGKNLGDFSSKAAAEKHEREVEYFKHKGK